MRSLVRVLTVSDLHQSRLHYRSLEHAVDVHRPDVLACVGDVLDALTFDERLQFTTAECAKILAMLRVPEIHFVRGNHEDANWSEFVGSWPHDHRPLTALYGASASLGASPFKVIGFPCRTGSEISWCAHLGQDNRMTLAPPQCREELPVEFERWLPRLMQQTGPAGRTLWLLHEPPVRALAADNLCNPEWERALERFQPLIAVSGHDHFTPLRTGLWQTKVGNSTCVNVGQSQTVLHYCVIDIEQVGDESLPRKISLQAFPWMNGTP